jgi:hypothetical protein
LYGDFSFLTVRTVPQKRNRACDRKQVSPKNKMPRNTTGGSGHRSQRNSESNKTKANNKIIDNFLDDIVTGQEMTDVHVGRVMRRLGSGMMEIFYVIPETIEKKERMVDKLVHAPLRGGMRGRGKKDVWVDVGSVILLADTGLGGTPFKIVSVFSEMQTQRYKDIVPNADPRLFIRASADEQDEGGIEFALDEEEVDVDTI